MRLIFSFDLGGSFGLGSCSDTCSGACSGVCSGACSDPSSVSCSRSGVAILSFIGNTLLLKLLRTFLFHQKTVLCYL